MDPEISQRTGLVVNSQVLDIVVPQTVLKPVVQQTVNLDVFCHAATLAHTVHFSGHPQKKGLSPNLLLRKIKHVKGVSCVSQCIFVPLVHSVPNVVIEQSVGGRLQKFWHIWQEMSANPQVVSILKEGYALAFKMRPALTRSPLIRSGYANPVKNQFL